MKCSHDQHHGAHKAGATTPESDEATGLQASGFRGQGTSSSPVCAAVGTAAEADKAFTTLRVMLALRGFELGIVSDGERGTAYMVHKWSMSRELPSLTEVRAFAERARVSHG